MSDYNLQSQNAGVPPYNTNYERPRKRSSWWIPLLIIGVIVVMFFGFFIVFFAFMGSAFEKEQIVIKENSVLVLDLNNIAEYSQSNPFNFLMQQSSKADYLDIITSIRRAKNDDKINGIYYSMKGETGLSGAKAAELSSVLEDFKSSGKFIYSFVQMGSERNYYNALPSDKIFMSEEALLEMNGFSINSIFLKNALEKLGIEFYVQQFEDFKSAGEAFSRNRFSDSARYQLKVILDQRLNNFVEAVEKYRNIPANEVRSVLARGIYTSDSLKHYRFVDEILPEEKVKELMKEKVFGRLSDSDKLSFVSINRYSAGKDETPKEMVAARDEQIAVIYAVGPITHVKNDGWSNEVNVNSLDFVRYLRQARNDDNVKAIIIRIDSPGGSVIASDDIYNEIIKTREVKPVYASMSDVAASGGYYIAMACDTIIAHPNTITGSIGVFLMISNFNKMLDKLSIGVDTISTGPAANFLSPLIPWKDQDKKQLFNISEKIYKRFVNKAAESRDMSYEEMRSLAKGRVWTGKDATKMGLVDVQGGFLDALDIAKNRIGVDKNKLVYIKSYPSQEESLKSILKLFGISDDEDNSINIKEFAKAFGVSPTDFMAYWSLLPNDLKKQLIYNYQLVEMSANENVLMALPMYHEFK